MAIWSIYTNDCHTGSNRNCKAVSIVVLPAASAFGMLQVPAPKSASDEHGQYGVIPISATVLGI